MFGKKNKETAVVTAATASGLTSEIDHLTESC